MPLYKILHICPRPFLLLPPSKESLVSAMLSQHLLDVLPGFLSPLSHEPQFPIIVHVILNSYWLISTSLALLTCIFERKLIFHNESQPSHPFIRQFIFTTLPSMAIYYSLEIIITDAIPHVLWTDMVQIAFVICLFFERNTICVASLIPMIMTCCYWLTYEVTWEALVVGDFLCLIAGLIAVWQNVTPRPGSPLLCWKGCITVSLKEH